MIPITARRLLASAVAALAVVGLASAVAVPARVVAVTRDVYTDGEGGEIVTQNFDRYPIVRMRSVPELEIHLIESTEKPTGVGEVAVLRHLHRTEDRQVDMAAADHREAVGRGEVAGGRQLRDSLLAGVDQVRIFIALEGEGAHAEHAVLALQLHVDAVRDEVRHQRRNADAELDVVAVAQLLGGAGGHLFAGPSHVCSS